MKDVFVCVQFWTVGPHRDRPHTDSIKPIDLPHVPMSCPIFVTASSFSGSQAGSTWMRHQFIARPYMSICGFTTLLKSTLTVFWRCSALPLLPQHPCFVGTGAQTKNPSPSCPVAQCWILDWENRSDRGGLFDSPDPTQPPTLTSTLKPCLNAKHGTHKHTIATTFLQSGTLTWRFKASFLLKLKRF